MKKFILVASTGDRLEFLLQMIDSTKAYAKGWQIVLVAQAYGSEDMMRVKAKLGFRGHTVIELGDKQGMHNSKMVGLEHINGQGGRYVVCNADDDMEFTEGTTFDKSMAKLQDPEVGFVSLGWVRHRNALASYKYVDEFVKQKIVYTGGGMLFTEKLTPLLLEIPREKYYCDNSVWSVSAYAAGFLNYRYRGSCTVHKICRVGGRKGWIKEVKQLGGCVLGRQDLLTYRPEKGMGGGYCICLDKDVRPKANELHDKNRQGGVK